MNDEKKPYPSRLNKKNRSNSILNMMIGLVFTLVIITGAFIFFDNGEQSAEEPESVQITTDTEQQTSEEGSNTEEADAAEDSEKDSEAEAEKEKEAEEAAKEEKEKAEEAEKTKEGKVTVGGTITREASNDPIVAESIINTSWEPVGTTQKGKHVSVYEKDSIDWKEKIKAITYATGLAEDNMYVMMIKNGGGPQKSIGVVQSKDQSEKYRVHLEWIDGKGWKPVKMDVLKTLEGAY
ncbi:YrrS family protein [Planococcus shenhongbingii]|uniref:YrrS family protein n=1 Tax=Planococcus shenhongbingii TaxID=3058398 RepID=UPI002618C6F1|nr:YrrS family protein [Planococcus sp. N016]WKA60056.1 YrrS family protein [Planococcus sp. N016]